MLTGKALGHAIREAVKLKKVKLVDLADHFGVKPPSVQGWLNSGAIGKEKLPALWLYFSDVVGPEHWGLASFPEGRVPGLVYQELTDDERKLLDDFRILTDQDQLKYSAEIGERAQLLRSYLDRQLQRLKPSGSEMTRGVDKASPSVSTDEQAEPSAAEQFGIDGLTGESGNGNERSNKNHLGTPNKDRRRA
jgi:hypothetical protein